MIVLGPKIFLVTTVWHRRQMNGSLNVFNRNLTIIYIDTTKSIIINHDRPAIYSTQYCTNKYLISSWER